MNPHSRLLRIKSLMPNMPSLPQPASDEQHLPHSLMCPCTSPQYSARGELHHLFIIFRSPNPSPGRQFKARRPWIPFFPQSLPKVTTVKMAHNSSRQFQDVLSVGTDRHDRMAINNCKPDKRQRSNSFAEETTPETACSLTWVTFAVEDSDSARSNHRQRVA